MKLIQGEKLGIAVAYGRVGVQMDWKGMRELSGMKVISSYLDRNLGYGGVSLCQSSLGRILYVNLFHHVNFT